MPRQGVGSIGLVWNRLCACGVERPGRTVADRERLRHLFVCWGLLELAGVVYVAAYVSYELYYLAGLTAACMAAGTFAPRLARRGRTVAAAHVISGVLLVVVVGTTYASGGIGQAGHAWVYVVPLVAGLLGGIRTLVVWGAASLAATLVLCVGGIGPFRITMTLPDGFAAYQQIFDIILIFAMVLLIMAAFLRTRALAEAEMQAALEGLAGEVETRRRAEADARQADHAKSVFLATMSHEIRTPMNGVLGMTDLLLEMPLGEQQRGCVEVIKSSGESLLSILNDVLDYSKIEAGRMELESTAFDIRALVEQAVQLIAARGQEQRLTFIVDIQPDTPASVVGDPTRLRQVLMNLLGNAVKFTPRGEVEARLRVRTRTADVVSLAIAVRDTGVGIAPEAIDRLFQPFSQANRGVARRFGGTGLGLAISRRLMSLMGGAIEVSSAPGEGSTFTVSLDLPYRSDAPPAARPLTGRRVLVVDPHSRRGEVLVQQLESLGARASHATHGRMAPPALDHAAPDAPFDAVLVVREHGEAWEDDPRPDRLASTYPSARIVLLVEWGAFVGDDALRRAGVAAQVSLPVSSAALIDAVAGPVSKTSAASLAPAATDAPVVLIVDDNAVNRRVARHQLGRLGYRVEEAENGREALARVAHCRPAAVLMDIEMPVMDGYEATRLLRAGECGTRLPIIALTAHALAGYRERVLEAGMDDYLTKPIRKDDLAAALERLIAPTVAPAA